jgi:hypothetical protein
VCEDPIIAIKRSMESNDYGIKQFGMGVVMVKL